MNKIHITAEAVFDYEYSLGLGKLNSRLLKAEVEEYIDRMSYDSYLLHTHYFRCRYLDDNSGKMLMLFIYKAEKISIMQNWLIAGICFAEDWTDILEDEGHIRNWLKTKIADLPEFDDWVIKYRVSQIIESTEKTLIENVLQEVKNEFECKRDKRVAEELVLIQGIYFGLKQRRRAKKKTGCN